MKKKTVLALLSALVASVSAQEADFRTFTDSQGRQLEAKPLRIQGDQFTVTARNGRTYTVQIATLSPEDQQFAKKFLEEQNKNYVPPLEVRFQSGKGDRGDKLGDFDDRAQLIRPVLRITNRDLTYGLQKAKATVVTLGKHVELSVYQVLHKETFSFSIDPGQTAEMDCREIRLQYDDSNFAKFGFKYAGYVVVVQNENGKVINESTSPLFKDKAQAAIALEEKANVDRNFKPYEEYIY